MDTDEIEIRPVPADLGLRFWLALAVAAGVAYYFSNPEPQHYYDYTFRVADNMLRGRIAFTEPQPDWLNEFVPYRGHFYSVFPLGSVLTMLPFALLKAIGIITAMPAAIITGLSAAVMTFLLALISRRYDHSDTRRIMTIVGIMFGTWTWTNLTMGGAWQLALGFAMIGELGAIYFTVFDRRPLIAGLFFAMAFGNRTEVLLTAPFFMWLTVRGGGSGNSLRDRIAELSKFCAAPFVLGIATLFYNYVRFGSFTDFGYSRIPGVLQEPWYYDGVFSFRYIPGQAFEMLFKNWERLPEFPYLVPDGFSSSILWSSPFLLFLARSGSRDRALKYISWASIMVLTLVLWTHGNSGGWQFGYRYAMVLLPWAFVILMENGAKRISALEWAAYAVAVVVNAYATYLFHFTEFIARN